MIVEPEIVSHPKFIGLKALVGDGAMEMLVRIWGHAQNNKKGGVWVGATPGYVEIVATGRPQDGRIFAALESTGWVNKTAESITIHDWAKHNASLTARWARSYAYQHRTQPSAQTPAHPPEQVTAQTPAQGGVPIVSCRVVSCPIPSGVEGPTERERTGAGQEVPKPGKTPEPAPSPAVTDAQILASRTMAGILVRQTKELESIEHPSREQREELAKKRRELKALQARQSGGDFSIPTHP